MQVLDIRKYLRDTGLLPPPKDGCGLVLPDHQRVGTVEFVLLPVEPDRCRHVDQVVLAAVHPVDLGEPVERDLHFGCQEFESLRDVVLKQVSLGLETDDETGRPLRDQRLRVELPPSEVDRHQVGKIILGSEHNVLQSASCHPIRHIPFEYHLIGTRFQKFIILNPFFPIRSNFPDNVPDWRRNPATVSRTNPAHGAIEPAGAGIKTYK
ncbi:hypothetical protein DSECCO2_516580 [anaerobic digester metagenome]